MMDKLWRNQRGLTLVELLITVLLMGLVSLVVVTIVSHSLQTEREVVIRNELQREARFMMEYMTETLRDSGNYWFDNGANWVLCAYDGADGCAETFLTYDSGSGTMRMGTAGGTVLSNQVSVFTLDPVPIDLSAPDIDAAIQLLEEAGKQEILVRVTQGERDIELQSNIYFRRFD